MTLDEIEKREEFGVLAFRRWIADNREFFNLPPSQQENLIDYVAGLHSEIADLQAELYRDKWDANLQDSKETDYERAGTD